MNTLRSCISILEKKRASMSTKIFESKYFAAKLIRLQNVYCEQEFLVKPLNKLFFFKIEVFVLYEEFVCTVEFL